MTSTDLTAGRKHVSSRPAKILHPSPSLRGEGKGVRGLALCPCVLCLLALSGCGSEKTAHVSGRVTYKGEPVLDGEITMVTNKDGRVDWSFIRDGDYTIHRAPVGEVTVTVRGRTVRTPNTNAAGGRDAYIQKKREQYEREKRGEPIVEEVEPDDPARVPAKYSQVQTSGIIYNVKPGKQEYNLDLKP